MAPQLPIQDLIDDFVVGDRRLAERSDFKVSLDHKPKEYEVPQLSIDSQYIGGLWINVVRDPRSSLNERGYQQLGLLDWLLTYRAGEDRPVFQDAIAPKLREVRLSLGLTQLDVAEYVEVTRIAVSRWEAARQVPSVKTIYRWCQALGLVCPPKTALVRVVDD